MWPIDDPTGTLASEDDGPMRGDPRYQRNAPVTAIDDLTDRMKDPEYAGRLWAALREMEANVAALPVTGEPDSSDEGGQ